MMSRTAVCTAIVTLAVAAAWVSLRGQAPPAEEGRVPPRSLEMAAVNGFARVIVGLRTAFVPEGALSAPAQDAQRDAIRGRRARILTMLPADSIQQIAEFDTIPFLAANVSTAGLTVLANLPDVVSIEEDRRYHVADAESTPLVGATRTWTAGYTGLNQAIAILDTGVDSRHVMLSPRVFAEACFSTTDAPSSSVSLCPGGVSRSTAAASGTYCSTGFPTCGHGTHVAGIAAGKHPIYSGVAPDARLISVQVFSRINSVADCRPLGVPCITTWTSDLIKGLQYVYALHASSPVAAVNMSLADDEQYRDQATCDSSNPALKAAIDTLRSAGIATVVAAGNNASSTSLTSPSCISSAISVGATLKADAIWSTSNTAPFLQLLAPGVAIASSFPGGSVVSMNGTSMAAPHVSGAWAVLKSVKPSAGVTEILSALQSTGLSIGDAFKGTFPRIRIDLAAARLMPPTPPAPPLPDAPTRLTATLEGDRLTVSWIQPTTGSAPATYVVEVGTAPGAADVKFNTQSTAMTYSAGSIPEGTYFIRVRAVNSAGASGPSNEAVLMAGRGCANAPDAPRALSVAQRNGAITLAWGAPRGNATSYVLEAGSVPGSTDVGTRDLLSPALSITSGVRRGTYYVRVRGKNACGIGPASNEILVTAP